MGVETKTVVSAKGAFKKGASGASRERRRILIVSDAWAPQVNGVVRTLHATGKELCSLGHEVRFATPQNQTTVPLPTYPEIRLALYPRAALCQEIESFSPQAIHIATEGTMGLSARRICLERGNAPSRMNFYWNMPKGFPFCFAALNGTTKLYYRRHYPCPQRDKPTN